MEQVRRFGPFKLSFREIMNQEREELVAATIDQINKEYLELPFERSTDPYVTEADKMFLLKIMKLDPRDRPTASELLEDEWFDKE